MCSNSTGVDRTHKDRGLRVRVGLRVRQGPVTTTVVEVTEMDYGSGLIAQGAAALEVT